MGFERFSGIPGRRARAAVLDVFSSRFIFIPLFILFAAACLVITGCTDEEVAAPQERDDWADGTSPSFVKSSPHDKSPPYVKIWEPILGHGMFVGTDYWPLPAVLVLPGVEFSFRWNADLSAPYYPGPILFRYGWDIENLEDNREWSCQWNPHIRTSAPRSFDSGVHVFHVEARGVARKITRVRVELEVIPFTQERDLLWIDDWRLGGYIPNLMLPSETEHDEFWTSICSRAPGFDPAIDIFEADIYNRDSEIPLSVLADYRNVVWTYSSSEYSCWKHTIRFDPAPAYYSNMFRSNNLRMFLAAGGSALTCGRADVFGGLGETFPQRPLYPASVIDDLTSYDYDPAYAENSLAHDDYYVTVIDKVVGQFRTGLDMPEGTNRSLERDALRLAVETGNSSGLDFPDTLTLDEIVTCPWCFFNPQVRGFMYVEAYDPAYYMDHIGASSHPCFTPIYRMRSRNTRSPLNDAAIALRGTIGGGPGSCEPHRQTPYESFHFGFPLWFMEHEKVEQITDEIFRSWDIR